MMCHLPERSQPDVLEFCILLSIGHIGTYLTLVRRELEILRGRRRRMAPTGQRTERHWMAQRETMDIYLRLALKAR
ncbi:hypothetical protein VTK56DRAFT_2491 [Thermocarpiscus australiensis]